MRQNTLRIFIVDSFTDRPFRGNPAGVCIIDTQLSDERMLHIAQEINLSETAFICPLDTSGTFSIRYFSPKMEIPLCGHATLASGKVAFSVYGFSEVHFINIQKLDLPVRITKNQISMVFPVYETHPTEVPPALLAALGIKTIRNAEFNEETQILLLEIDHTSELSTLKPNFSALQQSHNSINGVLVTAASSTDEYDFHSRYFWPWSGTNEDPVTGGTHTFLTKYWAQRLGKTKMKSFQSSQRSGFMDVELSDGNLIISSQAVIVLEGQLLV